MADSRPNFLFVITDQQRFDTIGALGHEQAITPTLDRLVREGTSFTRAYVTAPSCTPSRASLFTGMYPHSTGVWRNNDSWSHSWVESLADRGYRCVNVGKMHTIPYETPLGFHERHVVENKDRSNPRLPFFLDQWDKALWTAGVAKPDRKILRSRPDYAESLGAFAWEGPEDLHSDNFVGRLAELWLERYTGDEPFFLQVGFPGPHPPYDPTPEYLAMYDGRDVELPHMTPTDLASQPAALKELRQDHLGIDHDGIVHLENPSPEQLARQRRHYLANVTMIDHQLGLLVDALEARGVLDNTVIVFTSDHGDCLNDHGHSQKWTMYDPSVRVPAIVWNPGRVAAGRQLDGLTSVMDLGPTVLELAGIEPPPWMEAQSLVPALTGDEWAGREYVFAEHARDRILTGTALMTMVRDESTKLVMFVDSEEGQLFDLRTDPHEETNRWDDPAYAADRARLLAAIARWRAESELHTASWAMPFR
ncbi:sulfatase [Jiangella asiatica]|uniref:Arylsulfatase n=1 Tax=Jiangella asiatica TaxID=2530372 RepID=A0A4R5DHU1_9ACTN|nr:sulfatase-like hydrolase/transferase [Jiangella asiatica]TDE11444.1 arylsulfatase [Jiangella asiatica]